MNNQIYICVCVSCNEYSVFSVISKTFSCSNEILPKHKLAGKFALSSLADKTKMFYTDKEPHCIDYGIGLQCRFYIVYSEENTYKMSIHDAV